MTSTLSSRQGLLTRASNRLSTLLRDSTTLRELTTQRSTDEEEINVTNLRRQLRSAKTTTESELRNVEIALDNYLMAADNLDPKTPSLDEILQKVSMNAETAQELINGAQAALTTFARLIEELQDYETPDISNVKAATVSLAPIPIPKFSGRIWEWENFWNAFNHSVHSRSIDNLYKMTYLLDALQGEAKESVKQYEVSAQTYPLVISHLKAKYGDRHTLIEELLKKLHNCTARSERLHDQQLLCEELAAIVCQLQLKGEHIDNSFLQKQIMGKFAVSVQRAVLRQKQQVTDEDWNTSLLLATIKEHIKSELNIVHQFEEKKGVPRQIHHPSANERNVQSTTKERGYTCFYCKKPGHSPTYCKEVSTRAKRLEIMNRHKLCHNCGGQDHGVAQCRKGSCRNCSEFGHHTSICKKQASPDTTPEPPPTRKKPSGTNSSHQRSLPTKVHTVSSIEQTVQAKPSDVVLHVQDRSSSSDTLVLVGQAQVLNPRTQTLETIHVLLDTGADRSFITSSLADRLQLEEVHSKPLTITTFGSTTPIQRNCGITNIRLWDRNGHPHCYTVAKIEKLTEPMQRSQLSGDDKRFLIENGIQLSLSNAHVQPQILLGCSDVFTLLDNEQGANLTLPSGLRILPSKLGYLVVGRAIPPAGTTVVPEHPSTRQSSHHQSLSSEEPDHQTDCDPPHEAVNPQSRETTTDNLTASWEEFCAFESSGVHEFSGPAAEERKQVCAAVWKQFEDSIQRWSDGYHVCLPWKTNADTLPDNKAMAFRRLETTVAKLRENPELLEQYHNTFMNQLALGIIEKVDPNSPPVGKRVHYLAHQAVITPQKETTKLRVVFDASAHRRGCNSLNDVLHKGPVILPSLYDILLRFRIGKIALTSDVEKAFLKVRLQPQDRDATRLLWLRCPQGEVNADNIVTYRFTRVAFGLNCSPFLLAGTINHHLKNYVDDKKFAKQLQENTYVDNVILTASSATEALKLYHDAKKVFEEVNMNLREFRSNHDEVNEGIKQPDLSTTTRPKVLGVPWQTKQDLLEITCHYPQREKCTKRTVAEQVASIHDPHGWLTPLTLPGKIFFQQLWTHNYTWDSPLSPEHQQQWEKIIRNCEGFRCELQRCVAQIGQKTALILFSDASAQSMAACAYLVQGATSTLIVGKCKLPPIRDTPTFPKLELNALTLACRLAHSIYSALRSRIDITEIVILSDSEIVLGWLAMWPIVNSVGVLVKNRIQEIRKIAENLPVKVQFGYVSTDMNPADCATRGLSSSEFENHIWWKGPSFLSTIEESWPKETRLFHLPEEPKEEAATLVNTLTTGCRDLGELLDWKRHNELKTCVTTVAHVLRFIKKLTQNVSTDLRSRVEKRIPELQSTSSQTYITATERKEALKVLIRNHQAVYVSAQRRTTLKQLKLRTDNDGILRCRGRMNNADLKFDTRQPILIETKTRLAELIVMENHMPLHCSIPHTMANVRRTYWIPKLRQHVRRITLQLQRCIECQKFNNLPFKYPDMDDLPECRVRKSRPFEHTGIDYFGPIPIRNNEAQEKAYGVIFTCTTTRLPHLELVTDMTTTTFLQALRRFFARRGIPHTIITDNGQYFLLAEQILRNAVLPVLNDVSLAKTMASQGIIWKTNTPYAPWQGAFYERLIKSVKQSLYKVMRKASVTGETLETLLTEVEGMLNSRPLTYQEERWEENPILRPIDFIQRDIVVTYPFEYTEDNEEDADYLPPEEALQLRTRRQAEEALRTSHKLTEQFWNIWSQQYLTALRETHKLDVSSSRAGTKSPLEGTVVLVSDPVLPRNSWKMGRIVKLKSQDGPIREAELKMPNGRTIRRPINHLIPLELGDEKGIHEEVDTEERHDEPSETRKTEPHYNLRPRRKPMREEPKRHGNTARATNIPSNIFILTTALILLPILTATSQMSTDGNSSNIGIECIQGGAKLNAYQVRRYELCAESLCVTKMKPPPEETVIFPPEITLHEHRVQWKLYDGNRFTHLELTCPPTSFCDNVKCWFCTANIFNPECSPRAAIIAIATIAYIFTALLYALCYVPMVIGKPFRLIFGILGSCLRYMGRLLWIGLRKLRRHHRRRRNNIEAFLRAPLLTIAIASTISLIIACQNVDVFSHETTTCLVSPNGMKVCTMESKELVKMNSLQREACIRFLFNQTLVKEIRILWKELQLTCEKRSTAFTRSTKQHVIDSKRCPGVGTCTGDKCLGINTSSKIEELAPGNNYPGITKCAESCGGPGCGCFYWSSGCLFYRIYNIPTDEKIYEIFDCPRWKEEVQLEIVTVTSSRITNQSISLQPAVTATLNHTTITLSSLTIPPTPTLASKFISDGAHLALWNSEGKLNLVCDSEESASSLNCTVNTDCECEPAENKVHCACTDVPITDIFENEVQNRFPVLRPWITFKPLEHDPTIATAYVPTFTTAEFIIHTKERFNKVVTDVTNSVCRVNNAIAKGCYQCPQGAESKIVCTTDGLPVMASIRCDDTHFTVPCSPEGAESTLRFVHTLARMRKVCDVNCGSTTTTFEITGILQWTRTIHSSAKKILMGESTLYDEFVLPDFGHIFDVLFEWYKTFFATMVVFVAAITPFMEDVRTRLEKIENNTADVAKPSDVNDASVALTIRWDEIYQDVQRTKELLELHNFQKLSFEINLLQGRFDAMESRLAALTTVNVTRASAEPTPRRSGKERLLQLLQTTKSELAKVRSDTKEIAAEIEERESTLSEDASSDSHRLDELKEKRGRLRAQESTLEREISTLERRIRSEREDDRHQADSRRQGRTSTSATRTHHGEREREDSRSRQGSRRREKSRHREDDSHSAEDEIRPKVPSIVVRPPGV